MDTSFLTSDAVADREAQYPPPLLCCFFRITGPEEDRWPGWWQVREEGPVPRVSPAWRGVGPGPSGALGGHTCVQSFLRKHRHRVPFPQEEQSIPTPYFSAAAPCNGPEPPPPTVTALHLFIQQQRWDREAEGERKRGCGVGGGEARGAEGREGQ